MTSVTIEEVISNKVIITLSEAEGQSLSDLLSNGVNYRSLRYLDLDTLSYVLAGVFPENKHSFTQEAVTGTVLA